MAEKKQLVSIAQKYRNRDEITPLEMKTLLAFEKTVTETKILSLLKRITVPLSLLVGFLFVVFSDYFTSQISHLPNWTNMSPSLLNGVDYLWDILGEPVGKPNIVYHIPNIILYSFGILGIKKIIDSLDRRTWLDRVLSAQSELRESVARGTVNFRLKKGHSLLFVGKGDFIGMQFCLNQKANETVTIAEQKPQYTDVWNFYNVDTMYEDLQHVIRLAGGINAGEYVFFPVKDDQIFLPGEKAYDLSPHKLDILCQNIRKIESENGWTMKRIIIIGDKFHQSIVQSEDHRSIISGSKDIISLESIAQKYTDVTLLDPTDIVLREILRIAQGRRIVFRATKDGISEYKKRFYMRLTLLGYRETTRKRGILTIGYDLFEDQTEQQTLARKIDDYFPVVLSKSVHDALIRNGYQKSEFLYVPDLVLKTLDRTASEQ